jgi:hypothetical protein
MKTPLAIVCASAAWEALAPACGGEILLGDNPGPAAGDGGGAGPTDGTRGPLVESGVGVNDDAGSRGTPDGTQVSSDAGTPVVVDSGGPCSCTTTADCTIAACGSPPSGQQQYCCSSGLCYAWVGGCPGAPPVNGGTVTCNNLQFNPHNCGTCGHDCLGGACQGGTCVPLPPGVLASGQLTPSSIAVDDANVYWVNEATVTLDNGIVPTQILKCAKSGCNNSPTVLVTWFNSQEFNNQRGLAVDGKNVYWGEGRAEIVFPTGLFACAKGGCNNTPTELRQMVDFGDIAVNGTQVYAIGAGILWFDGGGTPGNGGPLAGMGPWEVYGCSIDGCDSEAAAPTVLWSTPQSANVASIVGLTVDALSAYFASTVDGTILSCALAGCGGIPTVLASSGSTLDGGGTLLPWQLAVDQTNVYWDLTRYQPNLAGPADGQVLACAKGGCNNGPTVLASGLRNPGGLTTDGANVYFTERGVTMNNNAMDGRVSKCAIAGCSNQATTLASNLSYPHGIAVDASHVYWTDLGSGALANAGTSEGATTFDGRIMMAPK